MKTLIRCIFLAGVAFIAQAAPAKSPAAVDASRLVAAEKDAANWLSHGRTYSEQRFSPLNQVNDTNVQKLGLAWSFKIDEDRVVEGTPIVVDGVMYATGAYSVVYALDAVTGKWLWTYDPKVEKWKASRGCCDAANRGVAVWNGRVYVGVYDGRLEAIDARTGKLAWSVDTVADKTRNYTITGAPRIVKGKVIIGNGGSEFGVRGYVTAYDAATGKQAWRFFIVPGDPAKGDETATITMARKTWFGDQYWKQGGGGTAWDSMAYDPDLDLFYIGTGNGSFWNYQARSEGKGDNLFLSSIVAVRPDTGEYVWHYQTTPGDAWDYTATQSISLADLTIDGKLRKVLMQAPKNGFFYVIDRATGELISGEKYGKNVTWAKGIDKATGRPIVDEAVAAYWKDGKPRIVSPGSQGNHNWHPMSFNPMTGLAYIPAHETLERYSPLAVQVPPQLGTPNLGMEVPVVPESLAELMGLKTLFSGRLLAWDPIKQKTAWEFPHAGMGNGGTLSTAGNLVFQGTADGYVAAFAADSGKQLWKQKVATGTVAGPVTYSVKGQQYVTFASGWGGAFPITFGALAQFAKVQPHSRIYTFKIGGKAPMPVVKYKPLPVPEPPAMVASDEVVNKGRELYATNCGVCHGLSAFGGGALPDLRYLTGEKHKIFAAFVYGLSSAKGMPSFTGKLDPDQTELIHSYLIKRAHDLKRDLAEATAVAVTPAK